VESEIASVFLASSVTRLRQMSSHIDSCLARLTDEQIWSRGGSHENAIGNLILHLCGNARQWIISGVGGAPDVRDRPAEFAAKGDWTREQLLAHMQKTVDESITVLNGVTPERLTEIVNPQKHTVPVLEAIYQVVAHFQQHTGQIIFATKLLSGEDLGLVRPVTPSRADNRSQP
jgi:uncharacterized damage-inducible protein DinB